MVLPHPLARERAAEAVPDDVDALRSGVAEYRVDERTQIRHVRDGRVRAPSAASGRRGCRTARPGSRGPTARRARSRPRAARPRAPGRRRRTGCTRSDRACRCCRGAGSPASASPGPTAPKPITGVPSEASGSSGSRAGRSCRPRPDEAGHGERASGGESGESTSYQVVPPGRFEEPEHELGDAAPASLRPRARRSPRASPACRRARPRPPTTPKTARIRDPGRAPATGSGRG